MLIMAICTSPAMAKKVKYPNGDVYKGKWKHGAPNGKGDMFYHDGRVYSGFWVDGKRSGQGKYIIPLSSDTVVYDGTWLLDKMQEGTRTTKDCTFRGTFRYYSDEVPMPYNGVMECSNGDRYEGEFAEDRSLLNGKSHISRQSRFVGNEFTRWLTEEMEYVNGERYEGYRCSDTTYFRYQCGNYHQGLFSGVARDRFPKLGLVKIYCSEDEVYRIEFQDTCCLDGNIEFKYYVNGKGEIIKYSMKLNKGEMLIDTGGVYRKGTVDEHGRFTGIVRLPSNVEGFSGTIYNGNYHVGRYNYINGKKGYMDGSWDAGKLINGVSRLTTSDYEEDGKYINGVFHGKRTFRQGKSGYQEGEWRGEKLYNGISKIKIGDMEEDGRYFEGVFQGNIKAKKYKIPNGIWVEHFDGYVHGDTVVGKMDYFEKDPVLDSFAREFAGTIIKGKRQGEASYKDGSSKWRNDTLVYYRGNGYGGFEIKWVMEMTLKGNEYHTTHYADDKPVLKNTYPYAPPMELFSTVWESEKEYQAELLRKQAQERQKNVDADRQKNWEYVALIKVATGYNGPTRGQVTYRYQTKKLYHKKGTSDNVLVDWSGEVTNYRVGENLSQFRKNNTYGQPVNWNVLGTPQWGNAFQYYVWGVGYFNL